MRDYDLDDEVTIYLVMFAEKGHDDQVIYAWTDDKELLKIFLDFHRCKRFYVKTIRGRMLDIANRVLDENYHDEIEFAPIFIKDDSEKRGGRYVYAPLTNTESNFINEETSTAMATSIDYSFLQRVIPSFKDKYIRILHNMFLPSFINLAVFNSPDDITNNIKFDEMITLYRGLPSVFDS